MTRVLVWFSSGFVAGLSLGYPFSRSWELILLILAVFGAFLVREVGKKPFLLHLGLLVCAALVGFFYMGMAEARNQSDLTQIFSLSEPVKGTKEMFIEAQGVLAAPVQVDGDAVRFNLLLREVEWQNRLYPVREQVPVSLYVKTLQEQSLVRRWKPGDVIRLPMVIGPPSPTKNPGAFDYRKYLHEQHIHWQASVRELNQVEVVPHNRSWRTVMFTANGYLASHLEMMYSRESVGLLKGMIIGEREAVGTPVEEDFAMLGIIHILAISGLHVGIVAALVVALLQAVGLNRDRAILVSALVLPLYAVLTGLQPPVVRAVIMTLVAFGAVRERRVYDGLTAISFAALLMLLWDPYLLFQVSFQLSFGVTLGLVLAAKGVANYLWFLPGCLRRTAVRSTLSVTLVAQAVSFPLLITYFHQFSFLSWFANLLFIPFFSTVVIPLGFLSLLLGLLHPGLSFLIATFNDGLIRVLLWGIEVMADWTWFSTVWPTPSLLWMAVYYLLLGLIYRRMVEPPWPANVKTDGHVGHQLGGLANRRLVLSALAMLWTGWVGVAYFPHATWEKGVRVTFLDVGQGDAIVIETPGEVWMIDAGGRLAWEEESWQRQEEPFDVGQDVVLPYLQHRGIRKLDVLVMTHGDADHIQGFEAVVEGVRVAKVIVNGRRLDDLQANLLHKLTGKGVPLYRAEAGSAWQGTPGVTWRILNPPADEGSGQADENDASVVLLLSAYGREVLFTGDLEAQGEQQMGNSQALPQVDVLKVGHHGSRTSTSHLLLETVKPELAVISVGENNRYGHPAPEVLQRLQEHGVAVLRTDQAGAVTLRILPDGRWYVGVMTVVSNVENE